MKELNRSYIVIVIGGVIFIIFLIILEKQNYHKKEQWPFTKGFYENAISGRIKTISNNRQRVTVRLTPFDSLYSFIPIPTPRTVHFIGVARSGDSLWKFSNSDSIYILSKNNRVYSWKFDIRNK